MDEAFRLGEIFYNGNIFPGMIGNIAAAAECNHKIHKGAGGAYGKEGNIFQGSNVP